MMKIMFVTVGMAFGGAERVMALLSNHFSELGYEVSLIAMDDQKRLAYPLNKNVEVRFMQTAQFNRLGNLFALIRTLRTHIHEVQPDVIISFFSSTLCFSALASLGMRIPLVFSERNDPNNNISGFKAKCFQYFALHASGHIVFQTAGARDFYGEYIKTKSSIILNPFDGTNLPPLSTYQSKNLVSVGRLSPQKNQAMLIEAFRIVSERYPDRNLIIYGEGPLRNDLQNRIDTYGLTDRVLLPGNESDILERIRDAELFLFSSDFEGLPNALIEAMALGLPCISTDCSPGGARALIDNMRNGILVPCGSPGKMAEAIAFLLDHPNIAERIGRKAREITQRLDIDSIAAKWIEVISLVVDHK